ncbi:hypothetical protein Leryth_024656 [Lithospermum erythrorhizon]|nr:hypothetical protein Leryth_024656 [Lithospermum erythrorhizon]
MENNWVAAVQLRQNVSHWRTLFYLEQLILKHDAAAHCIRITQMANGIDFFFADKTHALKFVKFIAKVTPMRCRHDQQLVSNPHNFKFTFSVEISPVCREDLICLPPSLEILDPSYLYSQVTDTIALLEPHTSATFGILVSIELIFQVDSLHHLILDEACFSLKLAIRGSKGHLLSRGDHALGYEVHATNNCIQLKNCLFPEVVLIKKSYEEKCQKKSGKPRS